MKNTIRFLALSAVFCLAAAALSGCPRVNCDTYCEKFEKCWVEFTPWAGRQLTEPQKERVKKVASDWAKSCKTDCKAKGGRGRDAKAINACLKKKDCKAFAKCFKPLMKKHAKRKKKGGTGDRNKKK